MEGIGHWTGGGTPSKQNHSYWNDGDVLWVSPKDMKTKLIVDTEDKITKDSIKNSSAKWISKDSILFVVRSGIIRNFADRTSGKEPHNKPRLKIIDFILGR